MPSLPDVPALSRALLQSLPIQPLPTRDYAEATAAVERALWAVWNDRGTLDARVIAAGLRGQRDATARHCRTLTRAVRDFDRRR
jgi:hypothetical protein